MMMLIYKTFDGEENRRTFSGEAVYMQGPYKTACILTELRIKYGVDSALETILKAEFTGEDAADTFLKVCGDLGVTPVSSQR